MLQNTGKLNLVLFTGLILNSGADNVQLYDVCEYWESELCSVYETDFYFDHIYFYFDGIRSSIQTKFPSWCLAFIMWTNQGQIVFSWNCANGFDVAICPLIDLYTKAFGLATQCKFTPKLNTCPVHLRRFHISKPQDLLLSTKFSPKLNTCLVHLRRFCIS